MPVSANAYAGTTDCLGIYADFGSLFGSEYTAATMLENVSRAIDAELRSIMPVPVLPLTGSGTGATYDYWLTQACALLTTYRAVDRRYADTDADTDKTWYQRWGMEGSSILQKILKRQYEIGSQVSSWEENISPAVPTTGTRNGTVPGGEGLLFTNWERGDTFGGNYPRVYLVQLDGTGSTIDTQSYRWMYEGGSAWEDSKHALHRDYVALTDYLGVELRWGDGTYTPNMTWLVHANPASSSHTGKGIGLLRMERG